MCPHNETFVLKSTSGTIEVCALCGEFLSIDMPNTPPFIMKEKKRHLSELMEAWKDLTVGKEQYSGE